MPKTGFLVVAGEHNPFPVQAGALVGREASVLRRPGVCEGGPQGKCILQGWKDGKVEESLKGQFG